MLIEFIAIQGPNADSAIIFTPSEIATDVIPPTPLKALLPIITLQTTPSYSTVAGIVILPVSE
jgi:hypothetical protein